MLRRTLVVCLVAAALLSTGGCAISNATAVKPLSGVQADGLADDSAAIQRALDHAAQNGGGTVELGNGRFRLDHPIRVPEGVCLSGTWQGPHHAQLKKGTVLLAYADAGQEDGPPLVTLSPCSTIKGLTFFYPEQRIPGTIAYPWTIQGEGVHCSVIDCTFVNPYKAMDFATRTNELHYIRNCFGCPLKMGIRVDHCTDIGRIENVHFNPHYWGRAQAPGAPKWSDLGKYLFENLVAFEFVRTDWEYVLNTFCFGAKIGYRFCGAKNETVNGNFLGIGADWCQRAVVVDACQMPGLLITNGEFVGGQGSQVMMDVTAGNVGPVQLSNCSFWGPSPVAVRNSGKGLVSLSQCTFLNHGKSEEKVSTVEAYAGSLIVSSCRFGIDRPDIFLGEKVKSAVISGNWFGKTKEIDNRSRGSVQEGLNVVGE